MVVGNTQLITAGTPVLLVAATGGGTHVVVRRGAGGFGGGDLLLAGSASGPTWFEMPADGTPVAFVLELGEELWADGSASSTPVVSWLVGNQ